VQEEIFFRMKNNTYIIQLGIKLFVTVKSIRPKKCFEPCYKPRHLLFFYDLCCFRIKNNNTIITTLDHVTHSNRY